jgi:flagellar capping protein FliD
MYDNRVTELEKKIEARIEKSDNRYNNIEDRIEKMTRIQKFFDAFDSFSNKFTIAVLGSIFLIACSIYEKLK